MLRELPRGKIIRVCPGFLILFKNAVQTAFASHELFPTCVARVRVWAKELLRLKLEYVTLPNPLFDVVSFDFSLDGFDGLS